MIASSCSSKELGVRRLKPEGQESQSISNLHSHIQEGVHLRYRFIDRADLAGLTEKGYNDNFYVRSPNLCAFLVIISNANGQAIILNKKTGRIVDEFSNSYRSYIMDDFFDAFPKNKYDIKPYVKLISGYPPQKLAGSDSNSISAPFLDAKSVIKPGKSFYFYMIYERPVSLSKRLVWHFPKIYLNTNANKGIMVSNSFETVLSSNTVASNIPSNNAAGAVQTNADAASNSVETQKLNSIAVSNVQSNHSAKDARTNTSSGLSNASGKTKIAEKTNSKENILREIVIKIELEQSMYRREVEK